MPFLGDQMAGFYKNYHRDLKLCMRPGVDNCALWLLKIPHSEAKEQVIYDVNPLASPSVLELLETIGNSDEAHCYKHIRIPH